MLLLAHPGRRVFQNLGFSETENGNHEDEPLWLPPIQRTIATDATGIPELLASVKAHRMHLEKTGDLARRERARLAAELDIMIESALVTNWRNRLPEGSYRQMLDRLVARKLSPHKAAQVLIETEVKA